MAAAAAEEEEEEEEEAIVHICRMTGLLLEVKQEVEQEAVSQ